MLELSGVPSAQAKADAVVVLQMETAMAKSAMEIVKRRDPKNLDNEMSLDAVQKLTPSFDFSRYLQLVHAPATPDLYRDFARFLSRNRATDSKRASRSLEGLFQMAVAERSGWRNER